MMFEKSCDEFFEFRIPGMTVTDGGALLMCYECRRTSSDWADIDIRVVRSTDLGASRETVLQIMSEGNTMNNPTLIADGETVHLLYCKNYRELYYRRSTDGGKSYSDGMRVELNADFPYTVLAVGPGHGIKVGDRLLAPMWFANNPSDKKAHAPSFVATVYSDDGGDSWQLGELIESELKNTSECALALLPSGKVLISIRNEDPSHMRALAVSDDGISDWSAPVLKKSLPDPICQGSMFHKDGVIYHLNCSDTQKRERLVIKASTDGFETYTEHPVAMSAGYSDLAVIGDRAYVLYEVRNADRTMDLHFASVELK